MSRRIGFFKSSNGRSPIDEFLDELSGKQAQKVLWVLRLIEEMDVVPGQYFQKMVNTDDLWEVRVGIGGNIFRLLCFFDGAELIVITHAFQKKTQKTSRSAITLAEERKAEYLRRKRL